MDLVQGLNKHFDIVVASKTEQDFYMNVYRYFDYIFTHPELEQIYQNARRNYHKQFGEIWGDYIDQRKAYLDAGRVGEPPAITNQPSEVTRLEKFDLYANAVGLEVRVYEPIKHFHECDTPDTCSDFCGALLVRGLDYVLQQLKSDYRTLRDKKKDVISTYEGWYKNHRDSYQQELNQFHMMFLVEVEKLDLVTVPKTKELSPFLNLHTGDFVYFGTEGNFPTSGQEFKVLKTLLSVKDYKATHDELIRSFLPSVEKATKTQKSKLHTIIRNIKYKLGVLPETKKSKPDPFQSVRGEGYRLVL